MDYITPESLFKDIRERINQLIDASTSGTSDLNAHKIDPQAHATAIEDAAKKWAIILG